MKHFLYSKLFPSPKQNQTHVHKHETSWEPAISGFGAASHDHGSHQSKNSTGLISRIADKVKSVDGIDETASLAGQILPGIAGAIATATILGAATPFVWLGVLGMKEEYATACEEFDEIAHRTNDVQEKIKEMTFFAQSKRQILKEKLALDIEEDTDESQQEKGSMLGLAHYTAEYHTLQNKKLIAALGKKFGWTGLVGMSGMFAGMLPATAAAGLDIANEISASAALESAAVALELASGSCFLAGQAAMTIYAANRGYQGLKAKEILEKSKQIFENNCSTLSTTTFSHVKEIIDKQIKFIEKHSIEYAKLTVAGQAAMIAGTVVGMTGFGLVATVPLFGVGAPLTVGGALQRIYYQGKEKKFKGKNTPFTDEKIAAVSPILLFTQFFEEAVSQTDIVGYSDENILKTLDKKVLRELDKKFEEVTTQLAAVKCYSLLQHVVNSKKTPEQKIKYLENRTNYLLDGLKNTGLENSVLQKMSAFYLANQEGFTDIISSPEANKVISKKVSEILKTSPEKLGLDADFFEHPMDKDRSRKLIAVAKSSLKSARFFTADSIVRVSQTIEARKILGLDAEGKNFNENYTAQHLFGTDSATNSCGDVGCQTSHNPMGNFAGSNAQFCAPIGTTIPLTSSCGDVFCQTNHNPIENFAGSNAQFCAPTSVKKRKKKLPIIKAPENSVSPIELTPSQKDALQSVEHIPSTATIQEPSQRQSLLHPNGFILPHGIREEARQINRQKKPDIDKKTPQYSPHKAKTIAPIELPTAIINSQLISKQDAQALAKNLLEKQQLPAGYTAFKEIMRTKLKDGTVHIIYQDPFDTNTDKQIHYITDAKGKLTIQHGSAATAIIPVNRQSGSRLTGIEIHTICNGVYEGGSTKQPIAHYGMGESTLETIQLQKTINLSRDLPHWQEHVKVSQAKKSSAIPSRDPSWQHLMHQTRRETMMMS